MNDNLHEETGTKRESAETSVQNPCTFFSQLIDWLIDTLTPFQLRMIAIGFALAVWTLFLLGVLS